MTIMTDRTTDRTPSAALDVEALIDRAIDLAKGVREGERCLRRGRNIPEHTAEDMAEYLQVIGYLVRVDAVDRLYAERRNRRIVRRVLRPAASSAA